MAILVDKLVAKKEMSLEFCVYVYQLLNGHFDEDKHHVCRGCGNGSSDPTEHGIKNEILECWFHNHGMEKICWCGTELRLNEPGYQTYQGHIQKCPVYLSRYKEAMVIHAIEQFNSQMEPCNE